MSDCSQPRLCENVHSAFRLTTQSEIDHSEGPTTHDLDASNG